MTKPIKQRRHVTKGIERGAERNGIPAPSLNGLCHNAWQIFDILTMYVDDEPILPTMDKCLVAARALYLNEGNIRTEFPRWRKWNGFSATNEGGA